MTRIDDETTDDDEPTLRQKLHAASGDREAEAEALADRTDGDVSEDDAEVAVRRAHGDIGEPEPPSESDVASPADARAVNDTLSS